MQASAQHSAMLPPDISCVAAVAPYDQSDMCLHCDTGETRTVKSHFSRCPAPKEQEWEGIPTKRADAPACQ